MECNDGVIAKKNMIEEYKIYKHSPSHFFASNQMYMITTATYKKRKYLKDDKIKEYLFDLIFNKFSRFNWEIDAWVILDNHYHLLLQASKNAHSLPIIIREIHKFSALFIRKFLNCNNDVVSKGQNHRFCTPKNKQHNRDSTSKIWWNYWDTCITYERSYFARLNYIHFNPVKHGYVDSPDKWKFSSYCKFCDEVGEEYKEILKKYPFNKVRVKDDF